MPTTISSREFDHDTSGAKRAALSGPVFITDRGRPAHVLLSIEDYHRLAGGNASIVGLLAMPEAEDIAFHPLRAHIQSRQVDLSRRSSLIRVWVPSFARLGRAGRMRVSSPDPRAEYCPLGLLSTIQS